MIPNFRRYILLSCILHLVVFTALYVPVLLEPKQKRPRKPVPVIRIDLPNLPLPTPEEEESPTVEPTPDPTNQRSMADPDRPTVTLSPTPTLTPTPRPTSTVTATKPPATATLSPTPTKTSKPPTATPSPKPSAKPTASVTATSKPTATKVPPTATTVPATATPQPTATETPDLVATQKETDRRELARQIAPVRTLLTPPDPPVESGPDVSAFVPQEGGMSTSFQFTDTRYLAQLRTELDARFKRPRMRQSAEPRVAKVYFKIMRNGDIREARIVSTSGHGRFDQAALEAVEAIRPFLPLPPGTSDLGVTCDFVSE